MSSLKTDEFLCPIAFSEERVALRMYQNIPLSILNAFNNPEYKGGPLIVLPQSGNVKTPTANEISINYMWLLPMVEHFPSKASQLSV